MSVHADLYPTRAPRPLDTIDRLDPVVHGEGSTRGPLRPEDVARYARDGYLFFPGFFDPSEIEGFLDDLRAYHHDERFKRRPEVILEPTSEEVRSVFGIHELSERFRALTCDPRLLAIAESLLGSDVYIHQSRINYKPGFTGNGFAWHSDFETWHSEDGMPRMRSFSVSILLAENHAHNGPLLLIPGSHRRFIPTVGRTPPDNWRTSLRAQKLGVPNPSQLREATRERDVAAMTGPVGSMILFECNTLHASSNNYSASPRSNLFFVYNSTENRLEEPYCGNAPRPEFLASRTHTRGLRATRRPARSAREPLRGR